MAKNKPWHWIQVQASIHGGAEEATKEHNDEMEDLEKELAQEMQAQKVMFVGRPSEKEKKLGILLR